MKLVLDASQPILTTVSARNNETDYGIRIIRIERLPMPGDTRKRIRKSDRRHSRNGVRIWSDTKLRGGPAGLLITIFTNEDP